MLKINKNDEEIKEGQNIWRDMPYSWSEHSKDAISPQLDLRLLM